MNLTSMWNSDEPVSDKTAARIEALQAALSLMLPGSPEFQVGDVSVEAAATLKSVLLAAIPRLTPAQLADVRDTLMDFTSHLPAGSVLEKKYGTVYLEEMAACYKEVVAAIDRVAATPRAWSGPKPLIK